MHSRLVSAAALLAVAQVLAQTAAAPANQQEIVSHQEAPTFRTHVDVVSVPVVVRDARGRAIASLTKEDFQLFDRGKPQAIAEFRIEKAGDSSPETAAGVTAAPIPSLSAAEGAPKSNEIAQRFVAYVFDDQHLTIDDIAHARDAAIRNLATLRPGDRAAVFTISGQNQADFTDDREQLKHALMGIMPRTIADPPGAHQCPNLSYYMADLIANQRDPQATNAAIGEVIGWPYPARRQPPSWPAPRPTR